MPNPQPPPMPIIEQLSAGSVPALRKRCAMSVLIAAAMESAPWWLGEPLNCSRHNRRPHISKQMQQLSSQKLVAGPQRVLWADLKLATSDEISFVKASGHPMDRHPAWRILQPTPKVRICPPIPRE